MNDPIRNMNGANPQRWNLRHPGRIAGLLCCAWLLSAAALYAFADSQSGVVPLMKWADDSRLDRPYSKDPCVIRFNDRYLMYFSLPPFKQSKAPTNVPRGWSIGIAESRDLRSWLKIAELWPEQECDQNGLCAPGAIVLEGRVHLFYQTYGNGPNDAICHAVSEDGVRFSRDPSNPVFRPSGDWTVGRAIDAEVITWGKQLLLYFATRDPEMKTQMLGVAGANLDSDFGRASWRQLTDGPILKPELPWERQCIEAASVCRQGDNLFMFYAGGYNNEPQQIGVAISTDGLSWRRLSDEPFLPNGEPGSWNSSESGHPGIFVDKGGETTLFFQGNNDQGQTWFLAAVPVVWSNNIPQLGYSLTKFPPDPEQHLERTCFPTGRTWDGKRNLRSCDPMWRLSMASMKVCRTALNPGANTGTAFT